MPEWFQNDGFPQQMYPDTANDMCEMSCGRVLSSRLVSNYISIVYTGMESRCLTTKQAIRCKQFRNPISPKLHYGFRVAIFDNEA